MTRRLLAAVLFAAGLLALAPTPARAGESEGQAVEEKSLLTPDGTLYEVRAGLATDLGTVGESISPTDFVIEWSSRRQDGTIALGLVPGTDNRTSKRNLDLAYDESSGSLVLLWKEDLTVLNYLRLAVFRNGIWSRADFLPSDVFTFAYNPRMLLSHLTVQTQDADGKSVAQTHSILSLIWWEDSQNGHARYAPIFLDEAVSSSDVVVYDLPSLIDGGGAAAAADRTLSAYMYPSLQLEGIAGAILATFADPGSGKQYVIRVSFPTDLGKPGPDNVTWKRRRIPVVFVASDGPISDGVPTGVDRVTTLIGASYRPTIVWHSEGAVGFTRFDGKSWSSARTIPLDSSMSYDRALRLVEEMAARN